MRLKRFSYRFAEQVLNSKLSLKQEIENNILDINTNLSALSRPRFNQILKEIFIQKGWQDQPHVFDEVGDPSAKMDFLKDRIGIEVGFGHASFLGFDLLYQKSYLITEVDLIK